VHFCFAYAWVESPILLCYIGFGCFSDTLYIYLYIWTYGFVISSYVYVMNDVYNGLYSEC
jgi:hypothetical protein